MCRKYCGCWYAYSKIIDALHPALQCVQMPLLVVNNWPLSGISLLSCGSKVVYLIPSSSTGCKVCTGHSFPATFFIYTLKYPVGETSFISLEVRTIQIYHACHVVVPRTHGGDRRTTGCRGSNINDRCPRTSQPHRSALFHVALIQQGVCLPVYTRCIYMVLIEWWVQDEGRERVFLAAVRK